MIAACAAVLGGGLRAVVAGARAVLMVMILLAVLAVLSLGQLVMSSGRLVRRHLP